MRTISGATGIELSGMVDLLLFRVGLRVSDRRKVSARQIFIFCDLFCLVGLEGDFLFWSF